MNDFSAHPPFRRRDGYRDNDARDRATGELEQALATLRPDAGPIDRDRLMFLAGRAMVERPGVGGLMLSKWLWPGATAVSAVAATVLGLLLALSHQPLVLREKVYVHVPAPHEQQAPAPPVPMQPLPDDAVAGAGMVGEESVLANQGMTVQPSSRVALAGIDYLPRTRLPPPSYFQKRQVALSLGIEALGSQLSGGQAEHAVAYRELLSDMVDGME